MPPFARVSSRYDNAADMRAAVDKELGKRRHSTRRANLGPFTGYRIGLDIGNGNIGWCVLFEKEIATTRKRLLYFLTAEDIAALNGSLDRNETRVQLPGLTSFVPLGTHKIKVRESDKKGEKSFSKIRAELRAKERLLDARHRRRRHVDKALADAGLLPPLSENPSPVELAHEKIHSDVLRVKLLDPDFKALRRDLGRALKNVLARRGLLKPVGRAGKNESSTFGDEATKKYREALKVFDCKTIGAFLERCAQDAKRDGVKGFRKRHRSLDEQEKDRKNKPKDFSKAKSYQVLQFLSPTFELIREEARLLRERQQANVRIDESHWTNIEDKAEFRRGLKAKTPGRCRYFRDTEYRCVRALPSFQRFRILEQLTHLRGIDGKPLNDPSNDPAFSKAIAILEKREKISLAELSRTLGIARLKFDKGDDEGKKTLVGAKTDIALTAALGVSWLALPIEERDDWTMRFLCRRWPTTREAARPQNCGAEVPAWTSEDDAKLAHDAHALFGPGALEKANADAGKALNEGDNFAKISLKAAKLLADAYAGRLDYERRLEKLRKAGAPDPALTLFERLPYYGEAEPDETVPADGFAPRDRTCAEEQQFGRAPNPDVHVVMNAVRRVVNDIIEMMGGILPTTCVVEVARSALSEEEATEHNKRAQRRQEVRQKIIAEIEKVCSGLGKRMPRGPGLDRLIDRWKAAMRQGWRDYDGSRIARSILLDGNVYQLDHVSPAAFGEFRENNLFVSRFNSKKGRRLPWQAFGKDPDFAPALVAFLSFGLERTIAGLEASFKPKPNRQAPRGERKKRLETVLAHAKEDKKNLEDHEVWEKKGWGEFTPPRPDVLAALRGTLTSKLDSLIGGDVDTGEEAEVRGSPQAFRPLDQARLFRRFHPDAKPPEGEFAARDVANIGWSTKLALRYLRHLGAEVEAIKPWAVHALRCMFNIDKAGNRHDLRNHAVDAFFIAHFDAYVLRPAFDRLRGSYEDIYRTRALADALGEQGEAFFDLLSVNIERLEAVLPAIGTAHRADNRWNPGDLVGGSFGPLGGENIYSFRPNRAERKALTAIAAKFGKQPENGTLLTYEELIALMFSEPTNETHRKLRDALREDKHAKFRYRAHQGGEVKTTKMGAERALPLPKQPGAFIDVATKFAIVAAYGHEERQVISAAEFTKMNASKRGALFANGQPVYRHGDTVISDEGAFVVTGLLADGRLISYPIDSAGRDEGKERISVPQKTTKPNPVRFASDVLGRRLHRLRKNPGGLKPVPYRLRGE